MDTKIITLSNGIEVLVSPEDYDQVSKYNWYAHKGKYAYNSRVGFMHRLIMDLNTPDLYVDHINHNTFDNRRENLRIVTKQQNAFNRVVNPTSTTGYKGVEHVRVRRSDGTYRDRYKVIIYKGKMKKYIGTFKTPKEAALKYNEIAPLYFGEYAYLNELLEEGGNTDP